MADNYLAGKSGYVAIGATQYSFGKWKLSMKTNLPKITNWNTLGYRRILAAINEATLTLEAPCYNQGNMPFTCGTSYTWKLGFTAGIELVVTAIIETLEPANDVEGVPTVNITAQVDGVFTPSIT